MILGLFIFLAGAVAGSLFDTIFFRGNAWDHSFVGLLDEQTEKKVGSASAKIEIDKSKGLKKTEDFKVDKDMAVVGEKPETNKSPSVALATETKMLASAVASISESNVEQTVRVESEELMEEAEEAPEEAPEQLSQKKLQVATPKGKLAYSSVKSLIKTDSSSYHAYVGNNMTEMVYSSKKYDNTYQCFLKKLSSDQPGERLFKWPGQVWTPVFTPDCRKIVFSSNSSKPEHIFIYDRDTKETSALTSGSSKNMMPAISPDGRLIAYVSNEKGNNDIWLIGIDGENKIQITQTGEDDREPRWLPDGSGLVFTRIYERLKKSSIMKITLEPLGESEELVQEGGRNWLPDVYPTGEAIAFVRSMSKDGSDNTLILKYLDTGKEEPLKPLGKAEYFMPVWVPDGSGFVFHANIKGSKNIYKAVFIREKAD
jgi:Tol biopolymer transport system component